MDRNLGPRLADVDPVTAGRLGLWLLGRRSHNAASRRVAFPIRKNPPGNLVSRFARLIAPWLIFEYPGSEAVIAGICAIKRGYAHDLLKPSFRLPSKHAITMAHYLARHASQCEALSAELLAYAAAARQGRANRERPK